MMAVLGVLGWLKGAFASVLRMLFRYPLQCALVSALAFGAWQTMGKQRLASDNKALATRIIQQKAKFEEARDKAAKAALAAKNAAEIHYRTIADETDKEAQTALADARSRADAYARRMRVQGTGCAPSGSTSPADSSGPESPDRSGQDAGMVALTRDDFDTLVENTIRLNEAQRWALTLNEPIPAPQF